MSVQILLYGKLLGIEEFLLACPRECDDPNSTLVGRSHWMMLLSEVLPRALLAEFGLSRVLLGSSGGGQFLLILPGESRAAADEFLSRAASSIDAMSGGALKLAWAATENLGDWSVVRKRLGEEMQRSMAAAITPQTFEPYVPDATRRTDDEYFRELAAGLWQSEAAGWNPEAPARIEIAAGKYTWKLDERGDEDSIPLARHAAPSEDGSAPASVEELAARAQGRKTWGVLRGDVDSMRVRIRRLHTIEDHVRVSVFYKQFFAGELGVLCSQPEFWRKVSVLYSGGDDFAVYGSWDALIPFAREVQRVFRRFTEEMLKDLPGAEGKTITMAMALAPEASTELASVYRDAGFRLEQAKNTDKDCISVLGRVLEWRHLGDAADLKDTLARMVSEAGAAPHFLGELKALYRKGASVWAAHGSEQRLQRPWRFQRRLNRIVTGAREREVHKLRAHLASEMMGRGAAQVKLRPAGLVALEWARLSTEPLTAGQSRGERPKGSGRTGNGTSRTSQEV
ncbi:MAG: Cas10/Cmr2 second palm domain-containing protein [bacterium]|jgi:CRISPR-associated protein Csm1